MLAFASSTPANTLVTRRPLRRLPPFRGPGRTLILFDPWLEAWLVTGWDGGEVLVPEIDLEAFLEHCARHLTAAPSGASCKDTRDLVALCDETTPPETAEAEPDPDAEPAT